MKGILFRPEVWQAKLKVHGEAQTRRVIKPQPVNIFPCTAYTQYARYQVGEVVYVKEAWAEWINTSEHLRTGVISTDEARESVIYKSGVTGWDKLFKENGNPWAIKSTLFMPEWAARYFIKFTGVKAERVQDITEEDAIAEGCTIMAGVTSGGSMGLASARYSYRELWNSINAKWKRVYNKKLKIYEYWQFPWSEEDAMPIPKTEHSERYYCIANPFVFACSFKLEGK